MKTPKPKIKKEERMNKTEQKRDLQVIAKTMSREDMSDAEYREYLKSDHWASLTVEAKMKLPRKCVACGNRGTWKRPLHLHHRTYEHLWAETVGEDVIYLCQWCHKQTHRVAKKKGLSNAHLFV